jgi:hypothetical protein
VIGASPITSWNVAPPAKSISARRRNEHARRVRSPEFLSETRGRQVVPRGAAVFVAARYAKTRA